MKNNIKLTDVIIGIVLLLAFFWMINQVLHQMEVKACLRSSLEQFRELHCQDLMTEHDWQEAL